MAANLVLEADSLMSAGKSDEALVKFNEAFAKSSPNSFPYAKRGYCYFALHKWSAAVDDAKQAVVAEPESVEGYELLARSLQKAAVDTLHPIYIPPTYYYYFRVNLMT